MKVRRKRRGRHVRGNKKEMIRRNDEEVMKKEYEEEGWRRH